MADYSSGNGPLLDISVGYDGTLYVTVEGSQSSGIGGVFVIPPGKTKPSKFLEAQYFDYYYDVASDYAGNVYASVEVGYTSVYGGVREFTKDGTTAMLPMRPNYPNGIDVAPNGDLVICSTAGVQTFAIDSAQPSSTIAVPCGDISLANDGHSIWVANQSTATRYSYPDGKVEVTLPGVKYATGIVVQGSISD